jgi:hypothetical protein
MARGLVKRLRIVHWIERSMISHNHRQLNVQQSQRKPATVTTATLVAIKRSVHSAHRVARELLLPFRDDLTSRGMGTKMELTPSRVWGPLDERIDACDGTLDQSL